MVFLAVWFSSVGTFPLSAFLFTIYGGLAGNQGKVTMRTEAGRAIRIIQNQRRNLEHFAATVQKENKFGKIYRKLYIQTRVCFL